MNELDPRNLPAALENIRRLAELGTFRVTQHAQQEMIEEDFVLDDVLEAIRSGQIIENYPDHQRGACCLLFGNNDAGRSAHVVCTTVQPLLVLITVYEPKPRPSG